MQAACPLGDQSCSYEPRVRRHRHRSGDLAALGERCSCGANDWLITFGGLLPARVTCGACGEGFNISQRLRECGRGDAPVHRRSW